MSRKVTDFKATGKMIPAVPAGINGGLKGIFSERKRGYRIAEPPVTIQQAREATVRAPV